MCFGIAIASLPLPCLAVTPQGFAPSHNESFVWPAKQANALMTEFTLVA
jgi:hypothetical protein